MCYHRGGGTYKPECSQPPEGDPPVLASFLCCSHVVQPDVQSVIFLSSHLSLSFCQLDSPGPTSCPLVFALQSSALVPLGLNTTVVLQGRNLDIYTVRTTSIYYDQINRFRVQNFIKILILS